VRVMLVPIALSRIIEYVMCACFVCDAALSLRLAKFFNH